MSRKCQILEIAPPPLLKEQLVEQLELGGMKCAYCHGNGWFWADDEYGKPYKDPCPVCHGTGRMKAAVTIEWTADKKEH